ncbi:MAG: exopolysaccharide biosynthesis polyprenyl glycosylphosphotransferase, partial [Raineya sp.]|nr:exopolysaccharide biosynthesis polyprenyl glycosylphosphotransferase [Raineya sp.]
MGQASYRRLVRFFYSLGDVIALNLAFLIAYFIRFKSFEGIFNEPYWYVGIYANLVWIGIAVFAKTYRISRLEDYWTIIRKMLKAISWHFALMAIFLVLIQEKAYSRFHLIVSYSTFAILIALWRMIILWLLRFYRSRGYNQIRIVIVGYGKAGLDLYNFVTKNKDLGYQFLGFFDDKEENNSLVRGKLKDLEKFTLENNVDEIYCSLDSISRDQLKKITHFADNHFKRIRLLPNLKDFTAAEVAVEHFGNIPVVLSRREPLNDAFNQFLKRSFDIFFSLSVILFIFTWLFPIIALLIKLTSKGPVFFKQKRAGKDGKMISVWKFRTMIHQKDAKFVQATQNDKRVTKIGHFLRKTSLDELPQFFNVLKGDMTVVGPRPHVAELNETFK